ncbi:MAG: sigma 54-interacting transcriptional regulator [Candidatus Edwardsbacteria bacterium]
MLEKLINNRYQIQKRLGQGGTSEVYKVFDRLERKVYALKIILAKKTEEEIFALRREFRLMSQMRHPNILKVYDFSETESLQPFFTMEHIRGKTIDRIFTASEIDYSILYSLLTQILQGLEFIHFKGLVHGDIKPQNILVDSKMVVKLTDFGMTQRIEILPELKVGGTLHYIAPEVARGNYFDKRADLYSLGILLYEILTQTKIFEAKSLISLIKEHYTRKIFPPSALGKKIPERLERILMRLLEKEPKNRFSSAAEVLKEISQIAPTKITLETPEESKPSTSYEVLGKPYIFSADFSNRETELNQLKELFRGAGQSQGQTVLIIGELGVGKTRLLQEFKFFAQLERARVFSTKLTEETKNLSSFFIEIIKEMNESSDLTLPLGRSLFPIYGTGETSPIGSGVRERGEAKETKFQLFEIIYRDLFQQITLEKPLVILIENLHFADLESLELLEYLAKGIKSQPGLICATSQRKLLPESTERDFLEIWLKPFSPEQTSQLMISMMGLSSKGVWPYAPMLEILQNYAFELTKGNPLFLEEWLSQLIDERILSIFQGQWKLQKERLPEERFTPKSIKEHLERHLTKLSLVSLDLAKIISLLKAPFSLTLLKEITNWDEEQLLNNFEELRENKIIQPKPEGDYELTYDWIGEYLEEILTEEVRKTIHQKIAEGLERYGDKTKIDLSERIASHYLNGVDKRKATPYALKTGEKLKKTYSNQQALYFFESALNLVEEAKRVEVLEQIGEICEIIGDYPKAINSFSNIAEITDLSAVSVADEPMLKAKFYGRIASIERIRGEYEKAKEILQNAEKLLEEKSQTKETIRILSELCEVYRLKGEYEKAKQYGHQAQKIAEEIKDEYELSRIFYFLALLYWNKGEIKAAIDYSKKSLLLKEKIGDEYGKALNYGLLGIIYWQKGEWASAINNYQQALLIQEKIGNVCQIAAICNNLGIIYYERCNWTKAEEHYQKSLEIARRINNQTGEGHLQNNLGDIYRVRGEYENSSRCYEQALKIQERINEPSGIMGTNLSLGRLYLELEMKEKSLHFLQQALKIGKEIGETANTSLTYYLLGRFYLEEKNWLEALKYLEQSRVIYEKLKMKKGLAQVYSTMGEVYLGLGELEEARQKVEKGKFLADELDDRIEMGKVERILGMVCKSEGEKEKANQHLKRSQQIFEEIGLPYELEKTVKEIADSRYELPVSTPQMVREPRRFTYTTPLPLISEDARRLSTLYEIGQVVNSIRQPEELLTKVLDLALELFQAERGFILLRDEKGELSIKIARNLEGETLDDLSSISHSIVSDTTNRGEVFLTSDARQDPRFKDRKSVIHHQLLSLMCVPLRNKGNTIGAIYIDHRRVQNAFAEKDLEFLIAFADQAAVALENAQLFSELQKSKELLEEENVYLKQEVEERFRFADIIGKSPAMQEIFATLKKVSKFDSSVLIEGETGTGKELIAKAIHYNSPRKDKRFVTIDCGALPPTLLESELFGHKRGAFTGAIQDKIGLLQLADGGTAFLDEIAELPTSLQSKLLRFLESGEIRKVGETEIIKTNVRIIAATNKILEEEVNQQRFRRDLYYRLNVVELKLPTLRQRREDIPLLIKHFFQKYKEISQSKIVGFTRKAVEALLNYSWPGNVRELENVVERAVTLCETRRVALKDLPGKIVKNEPTMSAESVRLEAMEKECIQKALKYAQGKKRTAAKILGISRPRLLRKIKKYKL